MAIPTLPSTELPLLRREAAQAAIPTQLEEVLAARAEKMRSFLGWKSETIPDQVGSTGSLEPFVLTAMVRRDILVAARAVAGQRPERALRQRAQVGAARMIPHFLGRPIPGEWAALESLFIAGFLEVIYV